MPACPHNNQFPLLSLTPVSLSSSLTCTPPGFDESITSLARPSTMVVIVDLSADDPDEHEHPSWQLQKPVHSSVVPPKPPTEIVQDDRPNLNLNGFSAALSCYP